MKQISYLLVALSFFYLMNPLIAQAEEGFLEEYKETVTESIAPEFSEEYLKERIEEHTEESEELFKEDFDEEFGKDISEVVQDEADYKKTAETTEEDSTPEILIPLDYEHGILKNVSISKYIYR